MRIMRKRALIDLVVKGDPQTCRHAWGVLKERFDAYIDAQDDRAENSSNFFPEEETRLVHTDLLAMAVAIQKICPRLAHAIRMRV